MSESSLETLVRSAAQRMDDAGLYFGHGTENAVDEACWLASHVLGLRPDFDESEFAHDVIEDDRVRFEALLQARIETRKPLAYLIGEAWFAGLRFCVNEQVLVPRSPLAELITEGFAPWLEPSAIKRAADVGTGSGCIAIALACHYPQLRVDALDISPSALALARQNVAAHGVADRVEVLHSDMLEAVSDRRYELILANPPYVPEGSMIALPPEYGWEPEIGLVAGTDGLDLVRRLLVQAADCLTADGLLVCEVGEAAAALDRWLADVPLTWLDFAHGGSGVFLLDRAGCRQVAARA